MAVFSKDAREITFIYNSNKNKDSETLGYIKSSEKKLNAIDIAKDSLTGTQWVALSDKLGVSLNSLIDADAIEGLPQNFDDNDTITILCENPKALKGTIAFTANKAQLITNPSKAMDFIDPDSEGIEKQQLN